jgi:uridine phosphorylase
MLVNSIAEALSVKKFEVNEPVLLSFSPRVFRLLIENTNAKAADKWLYGRINPLYNGSYEDAKISIVKAPLGAPAAVMMMEELIACGAKTFIVFGEAGSLQQNTRIGHIIIPIEAIREEGTSYHYLPENVAAKANEQIIKALENTCKKSKVPFSKGKTWTIDAPYREMKSKVEQYRKQGVLCVEMELSAMFSVGIFRHVQIGGLLVISDELFNTWKTLTPTPDLETLPALVTNILLKTISAI